MTRMCWPFLPAILFRRNRRDRSARCSGNTGSRAWQKNARPGCGGAGNFWGCMRPRWSEQPDGTITVTEWPADAVARIILQEFSTMYLHPSQIWAFKVIRNEP